jgi:hypothetical protein
MPRRSSARPPIGSRHGHVAARPRPSALGLAILVLSGFGFPLTQAVTAAFGRRGAVASEAVAAGLLVRDVALLSLGAPRRLRRWPALLLWLETAAAAAATVAGLGTVARPGEARSRDPGVLEVVRRGAVGVLFGLHTYRFWIYLQPDRGLQPDPPGPEGAGEPAS